MNCREFEADIVDLARGADLDAALPERLGQHLGECAMCMARLERERHLTRQLKELAGSAPSSSRAAAIEQELLRAFAERHANASRPVAEEAQSFVALPGKRRWLAAAAVLLLATAAWMGSALWWPAGEVKPDSTRAAVNPAVPGPAIPDTLEGVDRRVEAQANDAGARNQAPVARAAQSEGARVERAGGGNVLRFVTLPTAVGLPGLESGRIVRVELSTAMLPAYGFDVNPETPAAVVEADVLVGQDGQPRAIRFVSLNAIPRR